MSIIATDQWLKQYQASKPGVWEEDMKLQQDILCEKLTSFFPGATFYDIYYHLVQNGLFLPNSSDQKMIEKLCDENHWRITGDILVRLKQEWNDVENRIFIFRANEKDERLRIDYL